MSEPELATKAPESDATSPPQTTPSLISSTDHPAQTGPSMGEHCTTDRPLLTTDIQPTGTTSTLSSLNIETYISKPADYPPPLPSSSSSSQAAPASPPPTTASKPTNSRLTGFSS